MCRSHYNDNVALGKLLLANAVTDACCYLIGGRRPCVRKLQKTSYRIGASLSRKINFPYCFALLAGRIDDKGPNAEASVGYKSI
jgi:hypothetical protein